jgi:hypothetical protein
MGDSRLIPSLLLLVTMLAADPAATPSPIASATPAAEASPTPTAMPALAPTPPADATIENYRVPMDDLTERMIGVASRAVRFDWRRKKYGVGVTAGELVELNNFSSIRYGATARRPVGNLMGEMAVTWVRTKGGAAADQLAQTPYRQVGRPSRFELDLNAAYPLAEGVATSRPGLFPATEFVFSAEGGLRYLFYPDALAGAGVQTTAKTLFAPTLSSRELGRLENSRPPAMKVDTARYGLLTGLSLDVYFHSGGFLTPRAMVSVPVTGSSMGFWWELTMGAGWMF